MLESEQGGLLMISESEFEPITPSGAPATATLANVHAGIPIPAVSRVQIFSPEEFEAFVEEWANSLQSVGYAKVRRFAGSGDMGIDIAAFTTDAGFSDPWDNFQCKRYDHPLRPSDVIVEIGKIIYYSFTNEFTVPRKHYFAGSQDIGTKLGKLLSDAKKLKELVREKWGEHCEKGITVTKAIPLSGALLSYFDSFDFGIFDSKSVLELVSQHAKSKFHAVRFGGGLPQRPPVAAPPSTPTAHESRYVRQLLDAYGEHVGGEFADTSELGSHKSLLTDFTRQRERFYNAEALRNFSRDSVPDGTFAALQDEIFQGVVDVCEGTHSNGFERMKATVSQAAKITSTANALAPATQIQDRQGICHQLVNDDRLHWVAKDE